MKKEEDAGIAWIREIRHKLSAEFDHDPKKLGDHMRELEKKIRRPLRTRDKARRERSS